MNTPNPTPDPTGNPKHLIADVVRALYATPDGRADEWEDVAAVAAPVVLRWAAENIRNTVSFPWANGGPDDAEGAVAQHLDRLAETFERERAGKGVPCPAAGSVVSTSDPRPHEVPSWVVVDAVAGYEQYTTALANELGEVRTELEFERARLAEVQGAIHRLHARNDAQGPDAHGLYGCTGCDDGETWPCLTIQALSTAVLAVGTPVVSTEGSGHPHLVPRPVEVAPGVYCAAPDCPMHLSGSRHQHLTPGTFADTTEGDTNAR